MENIMSWSIAVYKKDGSIQHIADMPDQISQEIDSFLRDYEEEVTVNQKAIQYLIERYEKFAKGKKNLNGGFAEAKIKDISDRGKYYRVIADIKVGDCFGEPKSEEYPGCEYFINKENFRLMDHKEVLNLTGGKN